jgi:PKD domain
MRAPMLRLTLLLGGALVSLSLLLTASAHARVLTVGSERYGVQTHATIVDSFSFDPLTVLEYGGGPVMGTNATYAIYWDPAVLRLGDPGRPGKYHGDWQQLIDQFLEGIGTNDGSLGNVFSLTPQYTETTNNTRAAYSSTFRGGVVDRDPYPGDGCTDPDPALNRNFACFTDQQVRAEIKSFIANNNLHAGLGTIFYVLTPPDVTICTDAGGPSGHCSDSSKTNPWAEEAVPPSLQEEAEAASYQNSFCSYHAVTTTYNTSEPLLYAVIPWVAGTYGARGDPEMLPSQRNGSDCQDGTGLEQEPNQLEAGANPDGYSDHGLPDILINQIAAEQYATVTDPTLDGWTEPLNGNEAPDQCRNWFEGPPVVQGSGALDEHTLAGHYYNQVINGHSYYLNTEYNQAAQYYAYPGLRCELHTNLAPAFTAPNPVNAGDIVGFNGAESDVTLEQSADPNPGSQPEYRATFSWNFGDGTPVLSGPGFSGPEANSPLYASVFHSYQYGGTYHVTLTVTDAAGNIAPVSQTVVVNGPPPPAPEGGPGGATPNEGSSASGAGTNVSQSTAPGTGTGSGSGSTGPGPVATASAGTHSLARALRQGLVVNYSVSEQVAGHFEVLLDARTAHRLGVKGRKAVGLPAGSPTSLVIGQAILVTTKGGHSSVRIKFSKRTSSSLRRARKVTLLLRLVVRDSATQNPQSTTVLSPIVLHR